MDFALEFEVDSIGGIISFSFLKASLMHTSLITMGHLDTMERLQFWIESSSVWSCNIENN